MRCLAGVFKKRGLSSFQAELAEVGDEPLRKCVSHGYPLVERDPRRIRETYEEED